MDGVLATMHRSDIEKVCGQSHRPAYLDQICVTRMLAARQGRIVNISSIIASTGFNGLPYAASKAGLEGMTRSLSRELGKRGIITNCVAPGYMETEMTKALMSIVWLRSDAGPHGPAEPSDAAGAVVPAWPRGRPYHRTVLTVDGGSTA
jgi:3-oxoacyl-[acyl-carrier protein] reductase